MSIFVEKKPKKYYINAEEYVEMVELSGLELDEVFADINLQEIGSGEKSLPFKNMVKLLEFSIINWNIKDEDGNKVEFSKDLIKNLKLDSIVNFVNFYFNEFFYLDKKKETHLKE